MLSSNSFACGCQAPRSERCGRPHYACSYGLDFSTQHNRYDYLYSEAELREWVTRIRQLVQETRTTYVFFNNCHAGQAPANAQALKELLASF